MRTPPLLRNRPRLADVSAAAFLVALTTAAHFALARRFGLYEDDYAVAGPTLAWDAHRMADWVRFAFGLAGQGRPVGFLLGAFLPWAGLHLGHGLLGAYAVAAAVLSLNVVLFYALLRRAGFPRPVPLLAAMALALFPADTTQPFLCHGLILEPAMTGLLVAFHLYLGGRRWRPWSYLAVTVALLCYETAFPPFLAAPLLVPGVWNRRLPGRFVRHAVVVAGILIFAFLVRRWAGEVRAADTIGTVGGLPRKVALGCLIGPAVAVRQCGVRAVDAVAATAVWPAILLAWGPLAAVVAVAGRRSIATAGPTLARLAGCGVALAVLAYNLSFTHYPPDATFGRLTSVHVAAGPGVALLVAAAAYGLLVLGRRAHLFYPSAALVGGYLALLVGFATSVQVGFAREWQEQRTYWTRILHLCPDVTTDTVVLLRGNYPPESDFVLTKSWADYRVWDELYRLPRVGPPTLVDFDDWPACLDWDHGRFRWARLTPPASGVVAGHALPPGNVILIEARRGADLIYRLDRVDGTVPIHGHPLVLKPIPPGVPGEAVPPYPRRPLYGLLVAR